MTGFTLVWLGQVISLIGTSMTGFAITIWAWQETGQATSLALVGFFSFAPMLLFGTVAGALVDRWNRKLVMMLSDLASGLATIAVLVLYSSGKLEIWHLYITGAFSGIFQAFQWPAYSAAISTMLPKSQYARAGGMMSLAEWGSGIFSPVLAGMFLGIIGLQGILMIDIITFVVAILALTVVFVPQPVETAEGRESRGSLVSESLYGFGYILKRPSLLGLQMVFFFGNLMSTFGMTLVSPMILARTRDNVNTLATVQSAAALGGVLGSLLMTVWGGPKQRIHGVLTGWILSGLLGAMVLGINGGIAIWLIGSFFTSFFGPVINASNQAIWQSKVPPDVQGKVFSVRRIIAQITAPLAMLLTGPLADRIFEPAMRVSSGPLPALFGPITGVGPGTGMASIQLVTGAFMAVVGFIAYGVYKIRNVETLLPDHVQAEPVPIEGSVTSTD
jgi:MFS family permease